MTFDELVQALTVKVKNRDTQSTVIWSRPGMGRGRAVERAVLEGSSNTAQLRWMQLPLCDFMQFERLVPFESSRGVLFLDDIESAIPEGREFAQQLLLRRAFGGSKVPPGWLVWAAGDPSGSPELLDDFVLSGTCHFRLDGMDPDGEFRWPR
jgi:hypothetical protein